MPIVLLTLFKGFQNFLGYYPFQLETLKRLIKTLCLNLDIPIQTPDSTKLKNLTGWEPKIPIEKTLVDLLDYWDKKITI